MDMKAAGCGGLSNALPQSRRSAASWTALAGNYVLLQSGGVFIIRFYRGFGETQCRAKNPAVN